MTTTTHDYTFHLQNRRLGLWLFILSESFLFVALFFARFFMQGVNRPEELNQILGLGSQPCCSPAVSQRIAPR
jgi:heme/copper-type cytochrome/quinol oxidase subunit 3